MTKNSDAPVLAFMCKTMQFSRGARKADQPVFAARASVDASCAGVNVPVAPLHQSMTIATRSTDRALLVLRLAVATVFFAHGYMKLFGMGHTGVEGFFASLGIPLPGIAAWCVTLLESAGAIALAAGLFTRLSVTAVRARRARCHRLRRVPQRVRGRIRARVPLDVIIGLSRACGRRRLFG